MTDYGEEHAGAIHFYPPPMLDILFESNTWGRAATLRRKLLMTTQYSLESVIQHSVSTRESLNRSGGYEAFVYFGRFFPLRPDDWMAMEQTARDRFFQFFDDERLVDRVVSTIGAIRMMCSKPDAVTDLLDRFFERFGDKNLVVRLASTGGILGYDLKNPGSVVALIDRFFERFGDKDLVVRLFSRRGVLGKILSDTTKSLEGVDLLVKVIGPKNATSILSHNSHFLGPYLENPQLVEKALNELVHFFKDDKDGIRTALTSGTHKKGTTGFVKKYIKDRDAAILSLGAASAPVASAPVVNGAAAALAAVGYANTANTVNAANTAHQQQRQTAAIDAAILSLGARRDGRRSQTGSIVTTNPMMMAMANPMMMAMANPMMMMAMANPMMMMAMANPQYMAMMTQQIQAAGAAAGSAALPAKDEGEAEDANNQKME